MRTANTGYQAELRERYAVGTSPKQKGRKSKRRGESRGGNYVNKWEREKRNSVMSEYTTQSKNNDGHGDMQDSSTTTSLHKGSQESDSLTKNKHSSEKPEMASANTEAQKKHTDTPPMSPAQSKATTTTGKRKATNTAKPLIPTKVFPVPNVTQARTAKWAEKVGFQKMLSKDWEALADPKEAYNLIQQFVETDTVVMPGKELFQSQHTWSMQHWDCLMRESLTQKQTTQ